MQPFTELQQLVAMLVSASTIRLCLDYIAKGTLPIAIVLLQYVGGTSIGYLTYVSLDGEHKITFAFVATLLSRDILTFLVGPQFKKIFLDLIQTWFKK